MGRISTNAAAQTALRQLRDTQSAGDEARQRVATGLEVQSAADNPAFFLVSSKTRSDLTVLSGLRDNIGQQTGIFAAAMAGARQLNETLDSVASVITASQQGIALDELEIAFNALFGQAKEAIASASFQVTNLLRDEGITSTVISVDRSDAGGLDFQTLAVQARDFDRFTYAATGYDEGTRFVVEAENFDNSAAGFSYEWEESEAESGFLEWGGDAVGNVFYPGFPVIIGNAPRLDYELEFSQAGTYYFAFRGIAADAVSNGVHLGLDGTLLSGATGVNVASADLSSDPAWGGQQGAIPGTTASFTIAAPGTYTINIWGAQNGLLLDGFVISQDDTQLEGASPTLGGETARTGSTALDFFADPVYGNDRILAAGFTEVLNTLRPSLSAGFEEQAFTVLDGLRNKLNREVSTLGAYQARFEQQDEFLSDLVDALDVSVASLVETDLQEEASRLAALEVQEQLVVRSLNIANQRPASVLELFR